ncbi:Nucleoporin Nup37 [Liparis tanakae]|uniref:Nucleoporin Nup37 n=1 Tax=Liparis tanakae TaxID=230148 RepID=A0A4Z2FIF3_9TELE|nr:Nucleoporin Nup37 [Liparis tanakae]
MNCYLLAHFCHGQLQQHQHAISSMDGGPLRAQNPLKLIWSQLYQDTSMQEDSGRSPSYTVTCEDYVHVVEFSPFSSGTSASLLAYGGNQYVVVGTCLFQNKRRLWRKRSGGSCRVGVAARCHAAAAAARMKSGDGSRALCGPLRGASASAVTCAHVIALMAAHSGSIPPFDLHVAVLSRKSTAFPRACLKRWGPGRGRGGERERGGEGGAATIHHRHHRHHHSSLQWEDVKNKESSTDQRRVTTHVHQMELFCTAAADRKLRLLTSDLQDRHEVKVMEGHTSYINHLVFEPTEGKQIASVSDDHTCRSKPFCFHLDVRATPAARRNPAASGAPRANGNRSLTGGDSTPSPGRRSRELLTHFKMV